MKVLQISMDEGLLARLDADHEVQRDGRSAVIRRAVDQYLRQRQSWATVSTYERAYRKPPGLGREYGGWEGEGVLPEP